MRQTDKLEIQKIVTEKLQPDEINQSDKRNKTYKQRIHFDLLPRNTQFLTKIFNPTYIKSHAFLPFIFQKTKLKKIKMLDALVNEIRERMPESLTTSEEIGEFLLSELRADPKVKRLLLPKTKESKTFKYSTEKERVICKASNIDHVIYDYYSRLLKCDYEEYIAKNNLDSNVLAYRSSGVNHRLKSPDFASLAFNMIHEYQSCIVFTFDISSFFDHLNHQQLKEKWLKVLDVGDSKLPDDHYNIFKSLTNYSSLDEDDIYSLFKISKNNPRKLSNELKKELNFETLDNDIKPVVFSKTRSAICSTQSLGHLIKKKKLKVYKNYSGKGIPQGASISNVLSNIYMIDFDLALKSYLEPRSGVFYRYCDDVVCIVPTKSVTEAKLELVYLKEIVRSLAEKHHLTINDDKTQSYAFMPEDVIQPKYSDFPKKQFSKQQACVLFNEDVNPDGIYPFSQLQWLGFNFDGRRVTVRSSTLARYKKKLKRSIYSSVKQQAQHKKSEQISAKKLRHKYTHVGERNFIAYAYDADKKFRFSGIKKQLSDHERVFNARFEKHLNRYKKNRGAT